jgi:tRNA pseudouridine38-40 synthase
VVPKRVGVKNVRLVIEYDGTDFCGWQKQPKVRTVEGEIGRTLEDLLGFEVELIAAGRTDSGVHALGQVVNFSSISPMAPDEIGNALNSLLPPDVRIIDADEAPLAFNSRYDAKRRVYRYEITMRPTSIWRKHRWYVKWDLSCGAMEEAARSLIGDHDFSAYTSKDENRSPWISMKEAWVRELHPQSLEIVFAANRFLRRMVRLLTGTLVEVGRGKLKPSAVYEILTSRDRVIAGPCAPPHGLYLVGVEY